MAQASIDNLLARADRARQETQGFHALLDDAAELTMPNRNQRRVAAKGQKRSGRAHDSTGVHSHNMFAARIVSQLTPPETDFISMKAGPLVPDDKRDEVNRQLDPISRKSNAVYQTGAYHAAASTMAYDLGLSMGVMMINQGNASEPVQFTALPEASVHVEEGPWGKIHAWFRDHKLDAGLIDKQWDDAKIPEALRQRLAQADRENKKVEVKLVEAIYHDYKDEVVRYDVLWKEGNDEARLVERTSFSSPIISPRWTVLPGEARGRGPVLNALPDLKTLDEVVKMTLQNAALAIAGMFTVVDDGVINPDTLTIRPGNMIPVARNAGGFGPSIQELATTRNFDVSQLVMKDLQFAVKKALLDNQLPPDQGRDPTAFEIMQRMKELSVDASAAYGRLVHEWIVPMQTRVLEVLWNQGAYQMKGKRPIKPDQLLIRVQVMSPLARAQALADVENAVRWLTIVMQLGGAEIGMLVAKVEEILGWIGEQLGVPTKYIRTADERKQLGAAIAQAAAAMKGGAAAAPRAAQQPQQQLLRAA